jgi:hypothetical protein
MGCAQGADVHFSLNQCWIGGILCMAKHSLLFATMEPGREHQLSPFLSIMFHSPIKGMISVINGAIMSVLDSQEWDFS